MPLTVLRRTDPASLWPPCQLALAAHFPDTETNLDATPAAVSVALFAPGTAAGAPTYTATQGGALAAPFASFTVTTQGTAVLYEATIQAPATMAVGVWGVLWQASDGGGNVLTSDWSAFVVESDR